LDRAEFGFLVGKLRRILVAATFTARRLTKSKSEKNDFAAFGVVPTAILKNKKAGEIAR